MENSAYEIPTSGPGPLPDPHPPPPRGSGDDLGLPGLARYLWATLHDGGGARGALAVQAEAADGVLEGGALRLPLLQGKTEKRHEFWSFFCTSSSEFSTTCQRNRRFLLVMSQTGSFISANYATTSLVQLFVRKFTHQSCLLLV